MRKLIEALQIFLKYGDPDYPTCCEHDTLFVLIDPNVVSEEDKKQLEELGFVPGEECGVGCFHSYRFGSA